MRSGFPGRKCKFSRILRPNVPRRGRRPPPKRVFWVLYSSLESSRGVTTSHSGVGWIANWLPQPRGPIQRDPAPSRLRGGRRETWRQARDEKVIVREDGYTYIAALRSPDRRHTTKREGDTSVTVVTSNVSVSQCAGEMLKRKGPGLPNRRCREKIKIRVVSRAGRP